MARGSTPETTANVAIAITQRFQDATDFTAYHTDYDVWATNNHTQLGFQIAASLIYTLWGAVTCGLMFFGLKKMGILRVSAEMEGDAFTSMSHGFNVSSMRMS